MIGGLVAGFGGASFTAYRALNSRLDTLRTTFEKSPEVQREVTYMREKFASIETVDEMLADPRLTEVVTTAFGLQDQAFAKAFLRKIITEGTNDDEDLANRLVDPRYRTFSAFFNADEDGKVANFGRKTWVERLEGHYLTARFENEVGAANPAVQDALYFQRKAPSVKSFYDILGDKQLYQVVRTALGLPAQFSNVDIDRQIEKFESKIDLEDFQNPAKVGRMIDRYLAVSDAESMSLGGSSPKALALQTFASPVTGFAPLVSFDPSLFLKR